MKETITISLNVAEVNETTEIKMTLKEFRALIAFIRKLRISEIEPPAAIVPLHKLFELGENT